MNKLEETIRTICEFAHISRKELKDLIDKEKRDLSDLIDDEGALAIVAMNLGVKLTGEKTMTDIGKRILDATSFLGVDLGNKMKRPDYIPKIPYLLPKDINKGMVVFEELGVGMCQDLTDVFVVNGCLDLDKSYTNYPGAKSVRDHFKYEMPYTGRFAYFATIPIEKKEKWVNEGTIDKPVWKKEVAGDAPWTLGNMYASKSGKNHITRAYVCTYKEKDAVVSVGYDDFGSLDAEKEEAGYDSVSAKLWISSDCYNLRKDEFEQLLQIARGKQWNEIPVIIVGTNYRVDPKYDKGIIIDIDDVWYLR